MFYGVVVKAGKTVKLDSELGEVLHLSQACLNDPKDGGKTYLKLNDGTNAFTVCCLQKDKCEHTGMDLFIQTDNDAVSFTAEGKNDIHLVGYWEPHSEDTDDEHDHLGLMHDEAEGSEDEEDELEQIMDDGGSKKIHVPVKSKTPGAKIEDLDDLDDLEDLDDSDDSGDDDLDDGDLDDDEDDEEEKVAVVEAKPKALPAGASTNKQKPGQAQPAKPSPGAAKVTPGGKPQQQQQGTPGAKAKAQPKVAAKQPTPADAGQKRKATGEPAGAAPVPPAKQAKTAGPAAGAAAAGANGGAADAGAESKFQEDLTDYLKKSGRTSMSELGSKVKKPAGVAKKLQAFLKERTNLFKVENGQVELIK